MSFSATAIMWGDTPIVHYYGIILVVGALLGGYLAVLEARRRNLDPDLVWDALIWVLIFGVIGARLYHVFTPMPSMAERGFSTADYLADWRKIVNIRNGGLGIPGGVLGGILGLWLFSLRIKFANAKERAAGKSFLFRDKDNQLSLPTWLDIAAPGLLLAQAVGRWGNFVNQELYGLPTDLPWGLYIDQIYRVPGFAEFERFHPTFLYESILNLLGCILLFRVGRRYVNTLQAGDIFLGYMVIYPIIRILMEFLRLDSAVTNGFNTNQTLMVVVAAISAAILIYRHFIGNRSNTAEAVA